MNAEFEAHMRKIAPTFNDEILLGKFKDGTKYASLMTQHCWLTWQAALATQPQAPQGAVTPLTGEQIDKAYRDVWSTVPHAHRLTAFAHAIYALAAPKTETPEGEKQ